MAAQSISKQELFSTTPVPKALLTMAIPTIISQMINLIYNMVDTFFIGRAGNSYMVAATTITLTLVMMNVAMGNLFGIGGGSLVARLMGAGRPDEAEKVSSFSLMWTVAAALTYSLLIGLFINPILRFLGASDATIGFARSYAMIVIVAGCLPAVLSQVLAHLLRNTGFSGKASMGLSMGGLLNVALDPLFMFVILPRGQEVTGAAIATLISNICACVYLLVAYMHASKDAPLSMSPKKARQTERESVRRLFAVGVPSSLLTGLFDLASICTNMLAAAHSDLILAGMGIVIKVERIPNAVNVGICQGMLPIVAYNFASGNHARMKETIRDARIAGLTVSVVCLALFQIFARPAVRLFLNTSSGDAQSALLTVAYAAVFLRIRCLASPVQFLNYNASFCMQAMGNGKGTIIHAFVREVVIYIPFMFLLDRLFAENGIAAALPVGEAVSVFVAVFLLHRWLRKHTEASV